MADDRVCECGEEMKQYRLLLVNLNGELIDQTECGWYCLDSCSVKDLLTIPPQPEEPEEPVDPNGFVDEDDERGGRR